MKQSTPNSTASISNPGSNRSNSYGSTSSNNLHKPNSNPDVSLNIVDSVQGTNNQLFSQEQESEDIDPSFNLFNHLEQVSNPPSNPSH